MKNLAFILLVLWIIWVLSTDTIIRPSSDLLLWFLYIITTSYVCLSAIQLIDEIKKYIKK